MGSPPIQFRELERPLAEKLDNYFGVQNCLVEINPGKVLLPPSYKASAERIYNLPVKSDDTWLVSYPRTGSTWTQEMIWSICNGIHSEAAKLPSQMRMPLLELTVVVSNETSALREVIGDSIAQVENLSSPRLIKTHMPWGLLPKDIHVVKPKIVYVTRNPKDVCVSYYHYCRLVHSFSGTFEEFADLFIDGNVPLGSPWSHVLPFWKRRNDPNILFLKYEDMKRDTKSVIKKTSEFLGRSLTNEQLDEIQAHLSFNRMKENPATNLQPLLQIRNGEGFTQEGDNSFIRKGKVGDWKNWMSDKLSERFNTWTLENIQGSGLSFESEILEE